MIIQVEYPKSGGTWVYKMMSYYLNIPVLPLLISKNGIPRPGMIEDTEMARKEGCDGKNPFHSQNKFEYISQSHALPQNLYFSPEHCTYYLIRDGRDVVISYYFYETSYCKKTEQKTSNIKILRGLLSFYIGYIFSKRRLYSRPIDLTSEDNGLFDAYVAIRAKEWKQHIELWLKQGKHHFMYEDLLDNTHHVLRKILDTIGAEIDEALLNKTVELMSFNNCKKLENSFKKAGRFYRKGIHGDWRNHFSEKQKNIFKEIAGSTLIDLGYEKGLDW